MAARKSLHKGAVFGHRPLTALAVRPRHKPVAQHAADVRPAAIRTPALEASDALLER